jgi:branched-chain amino acid aminotransferase
VDLKKHLARLLRSAKIMNMRMPFSPQDLQQYVRDTVRKKSALRVKIVATARDLLVSAEPLIIDPAERDGIAVTCIDLQRKIPEAKALPYDKEWSAHHTAIKKGFSEALLIDHQGHVTEGAYSNVFWVKQGTLFTTKEGVLPGITRARVLTLAKKMHMTTQFADATRAELLKADEVFLTKSTTGITPVLRIDRTLIGRGKVGKTAKKLMASL